MSNFKYAINARYHEYAKYTIKDLSDQIVLFEGGEFDEMKANNLAHYFENGKKSSLLKKVRELLDFDMQTICNNNPKEKFDMLKILYLLYKIEKNGAPRNRENFELEKKRVLITNILATHSFENIENAFSDNSIYSKIFNKLYDDIKSQVNDAENRFDTLDEIDFKWYKLAYIYFEEYVTSNNAISYPEIVSDELKRIHNYLENTLLKKLKTATPTKLPYNEGVMKSFFNILNFHEFLCYNYEKIRLNEKEIPNIQLTKLYIMHMRRYSQKKFGWYILEYMDEYIPYVNKVFRQININSFDKIISDTLINFYDYDYSEKLIRLSRIRDIAINAGLTKINKLLDILINSVKNPSLIDLHPILDDLNDNFVSIKILWFVSKFKYIEKSDYTHYRYALKKIKKFTDIFLIIRDLDFTTTINFDLFIAMMQEIIEVKKHGGTTENLYYGRKHSVSYLKTSISDFTRSNSIANLCLITKIENRIAINYGQIENLKMVRKIENILYKIKEIIYQYRNLNDLVYVNNLIFPLAERAMVPNGYAKLGYELFNTMITHDLKSQNVELSIAENPKDDSVYDFFREIVYLSQEESFKIKKQITDLISNFYSDITTKGKRRLSIYNNESILYFTINKDNNIMEYTYYKPNVSDEKLKSLSLESFIYN